MTKELKALCEELKREIRTELREFRESVERDLRKELRDINASLTFINKAYEDMKKELNEVKSEHKKLRSENQTLQTLCEELKTHVNASATRILQCEQYSRNANVEIKGVPFQADENLTGLLQKLGDATGVAISPDDVEVCHRVPVAKNPSEKNIVVQFAHRSKRNSVLEKARRMRLTASDLGLTAQVPIYVNEHLCPELKKLLGQTTSRKRECGWKYVWVRNGQIFARKAEETPVVKISSSNDLPKITSG